MKCFVLLCVVGVSLAMPLADDGPYSPPPKYNPPREYNPPSKPVYKASPYKEEEYPPQPYNFEYGVSDQYTGTAFNAAETQDAKGTVLGEYRVNLPDGRVQIVSYQADAYGGFVADVKYEGEAVYPPEPAEGYGNTYKKNYSPKNSYAPSPKYAPVTKYAPAPKAYKPEPKPDPSYTN